MKKIIAAALCGASLFTLAACGNSTDPATGSDIVTSAPSTSGDIIIEVPDSPSDLLVQYIQPEVAITPTGEAFAERFALSGYDNPNFSLTIEEDGSVTVLVESLTLWTDYVDPESENEQERAEAEHRAEINAANELPRSVKLDVPVTTVYELPCSTWFPGQDAHAIFGTRNGHWYYVDLSGVNNGGEPELFELSLIVGQFQISFDFATTSTDVFAGEDFVIAVLPQGELIVVPEQ